MNDEQILNQKYKRVKWEIKKIASSYVVSLVKELELIIEGQSIAREIKELEAKGMI